MYSTIFGFLGFLAIAGAVARVTSPADAPWAKISESAADSRVAKSDGDEAGGFAS